MIGQGRQLFGVKGHFTRLRFWLAQQASSHAPNAQLENASSVKAWLMVEQEDDWAER